MRHYVRLTLNDENTIACGRRTVILESDKPFTGPDFVGNLVYSHGNRVENEAKDDRGRAVTQHRVFALDQSDVEKIELLTEAPKYGTLVPVGHPDATAHLRS